MHGFISASRFTSWYASSFPFQSLFYKSNNNNKHSGSFCHSDHTNLGKCQICDERYRVEADFAPSEGRTAYDSSRLAHVLEDTSGIVLVVILIL